MNTHDDIRVLPELVHGPETGLLDLCNRPEMEF